MTELSKWIWAPNGGHTDEYADFKAEFDYESGEAELRISADTDYAVYLNGELAAFGQYPDYPDHKVFDTVSLTSLVKQGKNEAYIIGYHSGRDFSTHIKRPAGIRFEFSIDGKPVAFSSEKTPSRIDPNFVSHYASILTHQMGFTFKYDATAHGNEFVDSVITDTAKGELYPRPIAKLPLLDRVPITEVMSGEFVLNGGDRAADRMQRAFLSRGASEKPGDGCYFLVDCGAEQTGLCELDIEVDDECNVEVGWGEHLTDGRCRTAVRNFSFELKLKKGRNVFLNPMRRFGGRYFQVFVYGLKSAKLNYLGIRPTPYPIEAKPYTTGSILRDEIYNTCVNTLRHSMHEHYEDCPWREQALYTLDSRNQMLCGYYVFERSGFPKASLELISRGVRPDGILNLCYPSGQVIAIPAFSLVFFVQMREYLDHTGDIEFIKEKYPMMKALMQTFINKPREDGLIENFYGSEGGYWNFYEWAETMEGNFNEKNRSIEAPINAFLSIALGHFAVIASKLGNKDEESYYLGLKNEINSALAKRFYNSETKLFESFSDRHHGTYSVLTNSLCLLCGAADGVDKSVIFDILSANGAGNTGLKVIPNTLSMNCFRFDALLNADEEKFTPVILNEIDTEYFKMLKKGATTFWETALGESDFDDAGSLCHGWSALPAYYYRKLIK